MSQLLVILGATGQQGGSLANFVLSDPALSVRYKVRGITRDPTQPAADALRMRGAEIVQGDLDKPGSLTAALAGAHAVFITTRTIYNDETKEREVRQGKAAADAAVAAGASYLIYSTEVHCEVVSRGRYRVPAYDSRGEVEAYIRTLPVQSAFYAPGAFMQNLAGMSAPRLVSAEQAEVYAIANIVSGDSVFPWIDVAADTGKFVGTILADPKRFAGKTLYAASGLHSYNEVVAKLSAQTGKTVKYVVVPEEVFQEYLPSPAREPVVNMFRFVAEYGYYGPETERLVRETRALVPYPLTTLDEFIAAHIKLE
ncbi:hypothetical protein NEMBOFW57_004756 [Staphylotrichum longicolle]|uniref:NmrA-like domain-containing protein n=1 Tax=Staphylotrichum longicolle TaxID=669026 RepID=A0AAD4I6X7_9PEZI|nr:hypothetical protein NEMBOFW57_004756 [Staphylotrichum longicolle]